MWPEQQPPGGEQNAQNGQPNPYQQPGQPNPYQQPAPAEPGGYGYPQQTPPPPPAGYGYPQQPADPPPGAYGYPQQPAPEGQFGYPQQAPDGQFGYPPQPPTAESWGYGQPPEPPKRRNTTKIIAITAAAAVVIAASVTAGIVLNKDDKKTDQADDKPTTAASTPAAPASPTANPRAGGEAPPQIPGWKVVTNPKYAIAFDVPPEWKVDSPTVSRGFSDAKKNDGLPIVSMSGNAVLKEEWCTVDSDKDGYPEKTSLANAGTKGGQGAKNTAEAARNEAGNWVWAAFAQEQPKGTVKVTKAKPYTTTSGLKGHWASATANGVKKKGKCDTDGKGLAFSFKTAKGDFASFVLFAPNSIKDEIPSATSKKILSTVRLVTQ